MDEKSFTLGFDSGTCTLSSIATALSQSTIYRRAASFMFSVPKLSEMSDLGSPAFRVVVNTSATEKRCVLPSY